MTFTSRRLSLGLLVILCALALSGFGCRRPESGIGSGTSGTLVMWGLWQESSMMKPVIDAFEQQTGIKVEYKKIASVATYESDLVQALAEGRGPDIFVIHHTWVNDKRGLMAPAPENIVNPKDLQTEFVDVVGEDLVRDGFVYSLPTSVDTMALFYNKDLLNAAGVARPPRTWQEFQQSVERLTKISRLGVIQQSGGAIGTAANVNRAPDIAQLLMLQSGIPIIEDNGKISISGDIGQRALTFYTDFANKSKRVYTWNLNQDFSIDAFAEGETAMMFNYSYHVATVQAKNPRLNFGIAKMPQISDSSTPLAFANYWPFSVSVSSSSPAAAWQFVRFLTSGQSAAAINQLQKAPPARRDNIPQVVNDPTFGVFAEQSLIATTWPRFDIVATDAIFNSMIDQVVTGATTVQDALRRAEDQLQQLREDGV